MRERATSLAIDLLTLAGFATFFVFCGGSLLCLPLSLLLLLRILPQLKGWPASACRRCFLPFAAGLLAWPMRLFYWDRGDFAVRVRNLLLLAALFSVFFLARERRWLKRFLLYFNRLSLKKRLLAIFLTAEILFILGSAALTRQGVALAGDEPHYLAISQSLARDGDLNIFNQYFRGGFKEFLAVDKLPAHGTWGKGFKKIYSYHLPGISLTLAPFFFVKLSPPLLYFLVRSYLGLFGALLAALVYLFCLRLWRSRSLAFFAVLAFSLAAPVFFYSFHVFPEVQAMLLVLGALYILLFKANAKSGRCLWAGLLLGGAIFWGVKYALFVYPITLGFFAYWLWKRQTKRALLLVVFPLLFQALFFYYLHAAYGSFSPDAIYYGMLNPGQSQALYDTLLNKITLNMRLETLLDYFFDQRDGVLLYNPFYFFAFPGLLLALKNFRRYRLHLAVSLPALLFVLNHAFSTIRAGYCPQGRYVAPVAWALLLFSLVYYRENRNSFFRKGFLVLPLYSLFVTVYQALSPFTLYQPTTHDTLERAGLLFQKWSNMRIDLPALLPSFIKADNKGYLPDIVFPAVFLLLAILALAPGRHRAGGSRAGAVAPALIFLAIFSLCSLFPRLDVSNPRALTGPRDLPCMVYFDPPAAPAGDADTWLCSSAGCRMRIESLVPLKSIEIRLRRRTVRESPGVDVFLFDDPVASLPPSPPDTVIVARPRGVKIGARFGYQLELRARGGSQEGAPGWLLGLTLR